MQSLNVLVVGEGFLIEEIKKSKLLKRLYTTSQKEFNKVANVKFNTFQELAEKCKALQIDIVIVEEKKYILQGIADVMKNNFINCIAPISFWTQFETSYDFAKKYLQKYNIKFPQIKFYPDKFPLLLRADGIKKIVNSIQEIVELKHSIYEKSPEIAKTIILEEYLTGEKIKLISLFDGKSLFTFPTKELSNIQQIKLEEYINKLQNMLITEKINFLGFINSYLVWEDNDWYNVSFNMDCELLHTKFDILYIFTSAIYQKLDEVTSFYSQKF